MVDTNRAITILDMENKVSKAGRGYTRVKCELGWLSCFKPHVVATLGANRGMTCECLVSDDNVIQEFVQVIGKPQAAPVAPVVQAPVYAAAPVVQAPVVSTAVYEKPADKFATMWASYAKDLTIALIEKTTVKEFDLMAYVKSSIAAVKQMKAEFS